MSSSPRSPKASGRDTGQESGHEPGQGPDGDKRDRRFYGRRSGHKLSPRRKALLDGLLPGLQWAPEGPAGGFGFPVSALWLEIGFGGGEHLAAQAAAYPEVGVVGCEPYINGVASLLTHVDDHGLRNVRIYPDDARDMLNTLPEAVLDRVFILFPDPWPKARHHRRRIVSPETLDLLAAAMKDGAELRLATDHTGYGRWMLALLCRHPAFQWLARGPRDWQGRTGDWPATRYEAKAVGRGEHCLYLRYRRRPR